MNTKLKLAVAAIALGTAASANAAFVVNDDAPAITAANPRGPKRESTTTISFIGTHFSRGGKATLDGLASDVVAAEAISLTAYAKNRALMANAKRRVATVKEWLTAHGVPDAKVDVYTEIDPDDDSADTDVQITTRSMLRNPPALVAPAPAMLPASQQSNQHQQVVALTDRERMDFARRIMAMAQAKIISGDDAIRLLNDFLNGQAGPLPPRPTAISAQEFITPAAPIVGGPIATAQPAIPSRRYPRSHRSSRRLMRPVRGRSPQIARCAKISKIGHNRRDTRSRRGPPRCHIRSRTRPISTGHSCKCSHRSHKQSPDWTSKSRRHSARSPL